MKAILNLALMLALFTISAPTLSGQARRPAVEARLVTVRAEPEQPSFGEAFDLHVTLRLRPGLVATLPDTLPPTQHVHGLGAGSWSEQPAAGDSLEIQAVYRMIAFQYGRLELPTMDLLLQPAGAAPATSAAAAEVRGVFLGGVVVSPYPPFEEEGIQPTVRPPADVLGGDWSLWFLLALGIASVAGLGTAGVVAPRLWHSGGSALVGRMLGRSPRRRALQELERIRSLGWHRNGRMDDFYALSTDTLRRYSDRTNPDLPEALTSTEVISRLEGRVGQERVKDLSSAIATAERVKFGPYRPEPEAAERDWAAIRDWIRKAPEA